MNNKIVKAHLALFITGSLWGLMSPVGKSAMDAGISSLSMAAMRITGTAICFWIASFFTPKEKVSKHDLMLLFIASLLCIVFNQGLFIIGLSLTSPIDSTVITTSLPFITMIMAALFLKEPITPVKITGVVIGSIGALILVLSNYGGSGGTGSIRGDILCLIAQVCFACYLTLFKRLILRYHVITLMKWMFGYAAICYLLIAFRDLSNTFSQTYPTQVWLQVGYVIFFGTFLTNTMVVFGQKTLRPTVVSMYNYMQPVVGTFVSVLIGLGTFGWTKAVATLLIFAGVYVVTQSKSREQLEEQGKTA